MTTGGAPVLVLNAGSSSIKAVVFDGGLRAVAHAGAAEIGSGGCATHADALEDVMASVATQGHPISALGAVAHRVVHGGTRLTQAMRITPDVRAEIAACIPLAPLHNPHHLAAVDWIAQRAPDLPQCASFDTAFHATIPDVARRYAIPDKDATRGLLRYGFHGTSYAAMVHHLAQTENGVPPRLLALHLGNGASACAILNGQSVATTMGYSPLGGLTMGTRSGDMDPGAVLELARRIGVDAAEALLNKQSGLAGLSGLSSDMRTLEAADTPDARFAIEHFCYWAARHSAALIPAMGGVDAIAFTGGIGENAKHIRSRIVEHLDGTCKIPVHVIPAKEEAQIARDAAKLMTEGST